MKLWQIMDAMKDTDIIAVTQALTGSTISQKVGVLKQVIGTTAYLDLKVISITPQIAPNGTAVLCVDIEKYPNLNLLEGE
jgi:hypothetical protein